MSLQLPQIKGENLIIAISASSSVSLLQYGDLDMSDAMDVDADEVIEIMEPGVCLIEMPDRGRFIARMESGTVTGPMRIMQIEEFDLAALQASPVPPNKSLAVVPGEPLRNIEPPAAKSAADGVILRVVLPLGSVLMGCALIAVAFQGDITAPTSMIASALGATNLAFGALVIVLVGWKRRAVSAVRPSIDERAAEARKRRATPSGSAIPT